MKKVRVGIVGAKFAADIHCHSYSRNDLAEVVAIADIADASELMQKWSIPDYHKDYREMFARDDIDLVSVCVPNFLHHDVAIAAAQAGKHVVVEKPVTLRAREADELIRLAREKERILTVFQNRRWDGDFLTVKKILKEGWLGRLVEMESRAKLRKKARE